ncbi:hypothetical protein LguiA_021916 [Lonicera macranthoides]
MNEMWNNLPAEVFSEILSRIPLKTLLQCTSVCKSWYSLITSPIFIATHLNRPISSYQSRLLIVRQLRELSIKFHWTEHYSLHLDNDTLDEFAKLDFPFVSKNGCFNIVGICKGLVCLSDDHGTNIDLILWNPSLKKSVSVPNPSFVCEWHGHFGFGIDPVTIDYKIVRLAYLNKYRPPVVELFELSTGSWRNIDAGDFGYIILPGAQQAFLNGVVHWTGYNPNKSGGSLHILIVSFDLRNESLGVVQVPPCVQEDRDHWFMRVTVFGERLAFLHSDGDRSWGLWVMKEYGVESSWTKQFTIEGSRRPTYFRENGDILLEVRDVYSGGWDLVSYDRKSKLIKNVDKFGTICSFNVDTYKESLVLVKGLNEVLGRKENSGGAATCEETSIMPKEENEVKEKRKI